MKRYTVSLEPGDLMGNVVVWRAAKGLPDPVVCFEVASAALYADDDESLERWVRERVREEKVRLPEYAIRAVVEEIWYALEKGGEQ